MNAPTKTNPAQTYQIVVYRRALHPELFQMKARRTIRGPAYEFEAWLIPGSHVLRFQHRALCLSELLTDRGDGVPTTGALTTFPCAGEKEFEHQFREHSVGYMTAVQTETLNENLFGATYQEMLGLARETNAVVHEWIGADSGRCLSMLEIQKYGREVHVQSTHLLSTTGLVLRSQSVFEHV